MADALCKLSLAVQALALAHLLSACLKFVYEPLYLSKTAGLVLSHSLAELLQAELHVVEILDSLAKLRGNIGQHCLEVAESLAHNVRSLRSNGCHALCIGNELHYTPVLLAVKMVVFAILCRNKLQHLACDVVCAGSNKLAMDVFSNCNNVVHEHIHIGENSIVHMLQYIVRSIALCLYTVSGIDKTIAQGGYFYNIALNVELRNNCVHWSNILRLVFAFAAHKIRYKAVILSRAENPIMHWGVPSHTFRMT